jgi:hypothetical protein
MRPSRRFSPHIEAIGALLSGGLQGTASVAPVTAAAHAALYRTLRAALVERHFALGRYFRADLLSLANTLEYGSREEFEKAGDPERRWNVRDHARDNPLLYGSQLLVCLAVETRLGDPNAIRPLRAGVGSLGAHFKFGGPELGGYPLRCDAATSDAWNTGDGGRPRRCTAFFIDDGGAYEYAPAPSDPRWVPYVDSSRLAKLPEAERKRRGPSAHERFAGRFRASEPSADELCGLIAGYFIVHKLLERDGDLRLEAAGRLSAIGDYLAEHAYMLVRPNGGFTALGAAGVLPALEYPFNRAFLATTGRTFPARTGFGGACEEAGVWPALEPSVSAAEAGGAMAAIVAAFRVPIAALGGISLGLLLGSKAPLTPKQLARVAAISAERGCFDVNDDDAAGEFAVAAALLELAPEHRLTRWLTAGACVGGSGNYAMNFPPFLGLLALDDADPTVGEAYLAWFRGRRATRLDEEGDRSKSCFAAAVAALISGDPDDEQAVVDALERRYATITGASGGDLSIHHWTADRPPHEWTSVTEMSKPYEALDYCAAVALAWLHSRRRADAGQPVTTPRFPAPPEPLALAPAVVPKAVVDARSPTIPWAAIHGPGGPHLNNAGAAELYADGAASRPRDVPGEVPAPGDRVSIDQKFTVSAVARDIRTGIVLRDGQDYEITATGTIHTDGGHTYTPAGAATVIWDRDFPLHGLIDPQNAKPFALLGFLGNYFYVGPSRARARWLNADPTPLFLRINDPSPGTGSGRFEVRVRVWDTGPAVPIN